jgi:O-antigen ligase
MFIRLAGKLLGVNSVFIQIMAGCCLGLILGLSFKWLSPEMVLGGLALVFFTYAILKRPEIALLGILVATSSIVYEDQLPRISVGISFHVSDVLLLGLFGIAVVRWLVEPDFKITRTPLDWPLLIFLAVPIVSTAIALAEASVEVELARRAFRIFSYYLTFFIVTHLVKERRQLDFLLNGIFILAAIVAGAIVLQFILGNSVQLLPGRVETLSTQDTMYEDITRVLPPGWSVVLVSFIVILCMLVFKKAMPFLWLKLVQLGVFGMALIFTFLRSYWAVLLLVFLLMLFLFEGRDRRKLIGMGAAAMFLVIGILSVISTRPDSRAAKLVAASVDRFYTLFDSGTFQGGDSSLNWRMIENGYAISAIKANPWLGLGMGFTYRPWDPRIDRPDPSGTGYDFRKHIHNGHLWVMLQSGLIGYLSLIWLSLVFLLRGFGNWRHVTDPRLKSVVLGFSLTYLAVFIAAVANSSFTQWRWTPLLGIMMGVNEIILMKSKREAWAS